MASGVSYSTFNIGEFHGVDYASNQLTMSASRSPDMMNLIPAENGALRSRNGYEEILQCDGKINGIYTLREAKGDHTLIHHGNKISEWKNHTMAKYVVPDEGLPVMYNFTIGEQTFGFTREKLSNDDDVTYNVSSGKLIVNGTEQELSQSTEGTPIHMECIKYSCSVSKNDMNSNKYISFQNPIGDGYLTTKNTVPAADIINDMNLYYEPVTGMLYNELLDKYYELRNSTSSQGLVVTANDYLSKACSLVIKGIFEKEDCHSMGRIQYFILDDSSANSNSSVYLIGYPINLAIQDIPEDGAEWTYYVGSRELKINTTNGYIVRTCWRWKYDKTWDRADTWMAAGGCLWYSSTEIKVEYLAPEGVNYNFTADGEKYYFSNSGLKPKDRLNFDYETKKLYFNDEEISALTEELPGQELVLEDYMSPLILFESNVPDLKSSCQQMGNKLYIFTGAEALVYGEWDIKDEDGGKTGSVYELRKMSDEAYIPTISIAGSPIKTVKENSKIEESGGGCTPYEDINVLSLARKESFIVSDKSSSGTPLGTTSGTWYYKLPLSVSPIDNVIKVEKLNEVGDWIKVDPGEYRVDNVAGVVIFNKGLEVSPVSSIAARDNYIISYTVANAGSGEQAGSVHKISKSTSKEEIFPPSIPPSNGSGYRVPKYKLYIGNNIVEADKVVVTLKLTNGEYGFNEAKIIATREWKESKFYLPNGTYADYTYEHKGGFTTEYWKIYNRVIQEGNKFYLEVSAPYIFIGIGSSISGQHRFFRVVTVNSIYITANEITYGYADRINKATASTKFGYAGNMDRLFVAGWDKMREYEFWSEVDNPLYFPDLNYAKLGDEDTAVMGWSRINNNQMAIHKEANGSDPTIYIQTAQFANQTEDVKEAPTGTYNVLDTYEVAFPVSEGPAGDGVISQRAFGVLNGEPLALSERGVFATQYMTDVAADVRYAAPRSYYINPKLKELNLRDAEAITFDNKYFLAVDGYVFVADGNQKYAVGGNQGYEYSYEWFPWDNLPVSVWWINDGQLHFGTDDGKICRFNNSFIDIDEAIRTYWTSPWLDFGTQAYYKKAKNVIVTCLAPKTDFCELGIDYITDKAVKNVKNYLIDNTAHSNAMKSIATNYKLKKINGIKIRVRSDNADDFGIAGLSILYTVSGKYKG